jgi:hypothetical protein
VTRDQVARLVSEAFADVPAPSATEIAHCEQCELWVERFLVRLPSDWRQIAAADLAYESSALTAVTPSAWRFFLPAYIVWHLDHFEHSSSNTVDHLIYQLTRSDSTDAHIADGYDSLSQGQVRAVAAFLEFVAGQQHDPILAADAQRALVSYWRDRAA